METTPYSKLYSKFLDDKDIDCRIYEMLANDVLGKEQLEKIKLRYDDMYRLPDGTVITKTLLPYLYL